jgi:hypothetical protein
LAQNIYTPYLVKESARIKATQLKTGIVGSYPRHTEEFNWETDWVLFRTIETSYTSFGEPAAIEYTQDGNKTREIFSYDGQHNEIERVYQNYSGSAWVNSERHVASYNASGYQTETRDEEWNGTSWDLKFGTQSVITQDGDRIQVVTSKGWNSDTQAWENTTRQTYSYNGTGTNYGSVIIETWNGQWVNSVKMDYTWASNAISEVIVFNYEDNAWKRASKYVYEYPNSTTDVFTVYMDDGSGGWTPTSRITSTVDSHGNLTLEQTEMYITDWMIFMASRYQLTYAGNNLTQRITQTYSMFEPATVGITTGSSWKNTLKEVFSNFASLSSDVTTLPDAGLSIFPNPAGKETMVRLSPQKAGAIILSVVSMTGQIILEKEFTVNGADVNFQLNLHDVRPGSYLLIARDKQGAEIGKSRLIKE